MRLVASKSRLSGTKLIGKLASLILLWMGSSFYEKTEQGRRLQTAALFAVLALGLPATASWAEPSASTPHTRDLLTFIRALEAPRGYDDYERRIPLPPPKNLTAMSVGEVLAWQGRVRAASAPSTAAGGYQIIRATLQKLLDTGVVSRADTFDPATQDRLARALIAECGAKGPPAHHPRYGNCLAGIWAALPLTAGPNTGRSAHHGLAGNRALTRPATVLALLAGKPVPLRRNPPPATPRTIRIKGGVNFSLTSTAPLVSRSDISSAMRGAARANTLTPSVRSWTRDPYALD